MIQKRLKFELSEGFTIIEIVIVIAIFSLLMLGLLGLYDWHSKVYLLERADTEATSGARVSLNNMTKYIAQASQILTSRTINSTTYTTGGTTVVLQLPSFDTSGNLIASTNDYVVYYKNGTSLYQLIEVGSSSSSRLPGTRLMSDNVQSLSFTYDSGTVSSATKVTIDLQTQVTRRGASAVTAHVTNTIFLRNR